MCFFLLKQILQFVDVLFDLACLSERMVVANRILISRGLEHDEIPQGIGIKMGWMNDHTQLLFWVKKKMRVGLIEGVTISTIER